jgi:sterol desaturase/sphingolipid hydroxylase (fatty acid hydroxylase superfamily)
MHPLDSALTVLFSLLPLALLGVPARVLVLLDAFVVVHIMLQHANVRMRLGWLNAVIAGPEFHRWHHSPQREEGETNYASFFSLWDRFFGTFRMPPGALAPEVVGLYNGAAMARSWRAQVLHPFRAWRAPAPP